MKSIRILMLILVPCFVSPAWPQVKSNQTLTTGREQRVVLTSASGSPESQRYKFVREWGALAAPGALNSAVSVAVDAQGNIFVADLQNSRIEKFDNTGKFLLTWGKVGHGNGDFWLPWGVAVDAAGNVFVADTNNDRIQVFTNDGAFITAWGTQGAGNGQFQLPTALALDSSGNVFVAGKAAP